MKLNADELINIIHVVRNAGIPGIYDIELTSMNFMNKYSSFECHVVLYPYDRKIDSDNIAMNPYEEYVNDVASNQRSSYVKIPERFNKFFGIFLGVILSGIFLVIKPEDLFSVQSLLAIFGAYALGQTIWDDIERFLIDVTKKLPLRYIDNYYRYVIEKNTTLTNYFNYAKKNRYGIFALPAEKIDFIKHSNSQTVRMYYSGKDLKDFKNDATSFGRRAPSHGRRTLSHGKAHLLSIKIDRQVIKDFEKNGFLFGIKLSLNKNYFFITRSFELFQSIDGKKNGCLDKENIWQDNSVYYRKTFRIGRVKFFIKDGLIDNLRIIKSSKGKIYE
jgi:hypothetical protein